MQTPSICRIRLLTILLVLGTGGSAVAQTPSGPDVGAALLRASSVKRLLAVVERDEPATVDDQVAVCEVPAPPFKEARRAEAIRARFEALGLQRVRIDAAGNVIGERAGAVEGPAMVLSAHLDTVFPDESGIRITRAGPLLTGLGIGDDCRGLAVLLAVARTLQHSDLKTDRPVIFAATVGEEGLGDLRGARALFGETLKGRVGQFASLDGTGLGITHIAVGSVRYRVSVSGPGGHSYGAFGLANPVHALGRAIAEISDFDVPREPKTTFNVGRIGGGTSINSIASDAWMEVDMRSADAASLRSLDARFHKAVDHALAAENERWGGRGRLVSRIELVGERPAGRTAADSDIVLMARSLTKALGVDATLGEGSTDSNVPIGLGIPAVTIGAGGQGVGGHSRSEAFDATGSYLGTQRAFLLTIALAGARIDGGEREE
ncbi:MAG: M20/M25/M40 family metallo-hydrolase [Acidobacteria bacterium]|nr:M20/M25/M40 family metallo-hydrolase [Acidobacteriota bacterium]